MLHGGALGPANTVPARHDDVVAARERAVKQSRGRRELMRICSLVTARQALGHFADADQRLAAVSRSTGETRS
jgi:hypothetical protein